MNDFKLTARFLGRQKKNWIHAKNALEITVGHRLEP